MSGTLQSTSPAGPGRGLQTPSRGSGAARKSPVNRIDTARALVQRRIGLGAVHDFNARIVPLLDVVWADADWHARAVRRLLAQTDKGVSLVDCLSFEIMETREITTAFTFDRRFAEQGFSPIPPVIT